MWLWGTYPVRKGETKKKKNKIPKAKIKLKTLKKKKKSYQNEKDPLSQINQSCYICIFHNKS